MSRLIEFKSQMPGGTDGILVSSQKNIRYLTGFNFTDGYALVTRHKSYVLADFRYIEAARAAVKDGWDVVMLEGRRSVQIGSLLSENHVETHGF
jgi:Xaa-Pro aminopeptidase